VLVPEGPVEEAERTTTVVEGLKDLAIDASVPVLAIVAADKIGLETGRRMRVNHLRGSSALAYEADVVLILNSKYDIVARHHLTYDLHNAERFREWSRDIAQATRVPHAVHDEPEIRAGGECVQSLPKQICLRISADRHVIDVTSVDAGHFQHLPNGERRKAGPVFHAPEALFLHCRHELSVAKQSGGHVAVIRVDSQDMHAAERRSGGRATGGCANNVRVAGGRPRRR